jgi:hypothetical protein
VPTPEPPPRRDSPRSRYRLELEAKPSGVPADVRLRRALKVLLRAFGLRCVWAREVRPGDDGATAPGGGRDG